MTATEHKSHFKLTATTPYLALTGEPWGVYYENFEENWPRYNGTRLYLVIASLSQMAITSKSHKFKWDIYLQQEAHEAQQKLVHI